MFRAEECSRCFHYAEDLSLSSTDFYKTIEEAVAKRQFPNTRARNVKYFQGGPFTARQLYLQVERDWLFYHIYAAPLSTGYFFSVQEEVAVADSLSASVASRNIWRDGTGLTGVFCMPRSPPKECAHTFDDEKGMRRRPSSMTLSVRFMKSPRNELAHV
jgi:hypothetical protein